MISGMTEASGTLTSAEFNVLLVLALDLNFCWKA